MIRDAGLHNKVKIKNSNPQNLKQSTSANESLAYDQVKPTLWELVAEAEE